MTLDRLLAKGRIMTTFAMVINEGNRFGLRLRHDAPNFIRAAQMFVVLAEGLGCKREVFTKVFGAVVDQVEADQEVLEGMQRVGDIDRALQVVAAWLDRVSAKDPALFRRLYGQIKGQEKVPANV
jgi:hypothetical protein